MLPVSYHRPEQIDGALELGRDPSAAYYAGGTTLIDLMKLDVLTPARLIDINHLPLDGIEVVEDTLRLGALARMSDAADHRQVRERTPAIAQALENAASGQLRNMATLGGNLLQKTRCAYYRDVAAACNKRRPGAGCDALLGINAEHAVLGTSPACVAVNASDLAVALVAFDAELLLRDSSGERTIALEQFYRLPGDAPQRETELAAGELIVRISVPLTAAAARSTYVKVRERSSFAFALASCAAGVERAADGTISDARIALGGVGTVPWRARAAENVLRGKQPALSLLAEAAQAAFTDAQPTMQNAYKIDLGVAAIVRALECVTA